ncbi:4Fe-4S binding protein [Maribellus sp. CM-23]|uniref:ATP-binding protein n=1 Tax=Maribellus sp. CM-23 TaxID=2781026 RepID=UPI001F1DB84F|nr:4Fe-4S binding protein [Maribellus sp. CM-23]MCE4565461.1 4Fe-4S binding protein [Maribellus sp. CM-23]
MERKTCVLFCRCKAKVISSESLDKMAEGLRNFDTDVFELQDLCAMTIHEKDVLNTIGKAFQQKIVVACYPRAVRNMFRQNGIEMGDVEVLNFKELSAEKIFAKLENDYQIQKGEARYQVQITDLNVPAWFPVIDESLCTLCGKCARFCLFGVYSYDRKSLKVVDPLACKDQCPACGRTCPTSAIMFPRLAETTVLAGDEPNGQKIAIDKGSLLMTLNARNQNRRNIFRQGVVEQAEEERRKALEEFKTGLDFTRNDKKDS